MIAEALPRLREVKKVDFLLAGSVLLNILMAIAMRIVGSSMYPFFILIYVWTAVYAVFLSLVLRRNRLIGEPLIGKGFSLALLVGLTVFIRLIFIGQTELISLDAVWYLDFGKFIQMDMMPYADFYFPYPPVFAYFIVVISNLAPSVDSFRILAALLDGAVLIVLWKIADRHAGPMWASFAALAYALLPISIIESGWNGHFEPLANLFMLLSLWFIFDGRHRLSGLMLGLAVATKIYPLLLAPIFFFYVKSWRKRIEFAVVGTATTALTYLPFIIPVWMRNDPVPPNGATPSSGSVDLFSSLLGFLTSPQYPTLIVSLIVFALISLGVFKIVRQLAQDDPQSNHRVYQWAVLFTGAVLVVMGLAAALYPLSPLSRYVYWRYPPDIGVVRGASAVFIGSLIAVMGYRGLRSKTTITVSTNSLVLLVSGALLLVLTMSRGVFYGWYLLWPLPMFFLLKKKRLVILTLLCLLLIYPSYTHDNFASLGFDETRLWQDEFISMDGWTPHVNMSGTGLPSNLVEAGVSSNGDLGEFWFDTSNVSNESQLENVIISYTKSVQIGISLDIEFVTRITSSWDPTFGRYADISLKYEGHDENGYRTNGTIIPMTSLMTNLTFILWRYSFSIAEVPVAAGTIDNLTLAVYPVRSGYAFYEVDFFYTTYYGLLNPAFILFTPIHMALALAAYAVIHLELEKSDQFVTRKKELDPESAK